MSLCVVSSLKTKRGESGGENGWSDRMERETLEEHHAKWSNNEKTKQNNMTEVRHIIQKID